MSYYAEKTNGAKLENILAESGIDSNMIFYAQREETLPVNPSIFEDIENQQTRDAISKVMVFLTISLIGLSGLITIENKNISNV